MGAGGTAEPGFGLYIHWPFCLAKCPYCDFNSHVARRIEHETWGEALLAEMRHMRAIAGPRRLDSIFFGGGTPSLMAPGVVAALIEAAVALWPPAEAVEITLEANPTSAEAAKFRAYAAAGVNRLSLGVQALDDGALRALGRTHGVAEAERAMGLARETFPRTSFDLIYARMGQTPGAWAVELERALGFAPGHLSLYQLTIEPGTPFAARHARGRLVLPAPEAAAEMFEITQALTAAAGLEAYEISNHARPGEECRHNLVYWRYGEYAGVGPGAHGRLVLADGRRVATRTITEPAAWLAAVRGAGHGLAEVTPLSPGEQGLEYLLMALRLAEGAEPARFAALAGRPLDPGRVAALAAEGLVEASAGRLRATPRGRLVLDRVLAELVADLPTEPHAGAGAAGQPAAAGADIP